MLSIKRIFKRKPKLARGLSLKKVDPDIRRLIKQTERQFPERGRMKAKLHRRRHWEKYVASLMVIGAVGFLFVRFDQVKILWHAGYLTLAPVPVLSVFEPPERVELLKNARKSGCIDAYITYELTQKGYMSSTSSLSQFIKCAHKRMEYST